MHQMTSVGFMDRLWMIICMMLKSVSVLQEGVESCMGEIIIERTKLTAVESFHTVHNYIDVDEMILRKGAIAAHAGEKILIPINMRDGSVLAVGKGNAEWNNSAPHGAGRVHV